MTNETQMNNETINNDEEAYTELLRQLNIVIDQRNSFNMNKKMQKIDLDADLAFEQYVREIKDAEANGNISVSVALRSLQYFLKNEQIRKNAIINRLNGIVSESEEQTAETINTKSDMHHSNCIIAPVVPKDQGSQSPALDKNSSIDEPSTLKLGQLAIKFSRCLHSEITRLTASSKTSGSLLVDLGLIESSDTKITALRTLQKLFFSEIQGKISPTEFVTKLKAWKIENEACIKTQRNKVHSFFAPNHVATSEKLINELFAQFNLESNSTAKVNL